MKKMLGSWWQEVAKVLKFILKNPSFLKAVLKVGFLIYKLLRFFEEK